MSDMFPSLPDPLDMGALFNAFPNTIRPLLEYHDRLLRDWSPLTVGERELIAAYVSGLNACSYCHGAHTFAAQAFGIDEAVFELLMTDIDSAPLDSKLRPLLAYVKKLTLKPASISSLDAEAVYEAGWEEQALFDAISVCALFNFMSRIVEGSGLHSNPLTATSENRAAMVKRFSGGAVADNSHEAPATYSRLMSFWGIT